MMRARVVFPDPGGPQKMHEPISPRRISSRSGFPSPSSCSWPRNSSSVVGRMRAASGSAERENNVGSLDTGHGKRDAGNALAETGLRPRWIGTLPSGKAAYNRHVRQLESLDAWKVAQELAYKAYVL